MDTYLKRGASADKKDVHEAIKGMDEGVFKGAFCKAVPDLSGDNDFCTILHADGVGTKIILAYLIYKETGDLEYFKFAAQDSTVMNTDDVLCVGAVNDFILSNTIGRNASLINGDMIKAIITGYKEYSLKMADFGLRINLCGGETADLGDIVRLIVVDSTLMTRIKKSDFINADNIKSEKVIVGFSSFGQAVYEDKYNSGIATNGLTAARHEVLCGYYKKYTEIFDPLREAVVYEGKFKLEDKEPYLNKYSIAELLSSPTRTYAPIMNKILPFYKKNIYAIFHNTGGGQSKNVNFGHNIRYVKDNLFEMPLIFKLIKDYGQMKMEELYKVFNMGHRLEIVCDENIAFELIDIAAEFKVEAKIIGHTEYKQGENEVVINTGEQKIVYTRA